MKLYRYVVLTDNENYQHISGLGILTALDYIFDFDDDLIISLTSCFQDELPDPDCNMQNTCSYFTKKGNRKFNKAIRKLKKAIESVEEKELRVVTVYEDYENLDVLYEDKYQVVASTL